MLPLLAVPPLNLAKCLAEVPFNRGAAKAHARSHCWRRKRKREQPTASFHCGSSWGFGNRASGRSASAQRQVAWDYGKREDPTKLPRRLNTRAISDDATGEKPD
jgi:hypothetical protein